MQFGDGSNDWLGGVSDFASDPGQLVRDPYDTVAGTADAAALNFDEGVGGLYSLVDDEPGNTAGPGQEPMFTFGASQASDFGGAGIPLPYLAAGLLAAYVAIPALIQGAAEGVFSG